MAQKKNVGDLIAGRLEIIADMGESELGITYLVKDTQSNSQLVVKQLSLECDDAHTDAVRQAVAKLRKIEHKNMSSLRDFIVEDNTGYILLTPIDGSPLQTQLDSRRENGQIFGIKVAYSFIAHIALALEVLHEAGVAYGGLQPRAIFVTKQGRVQLANAICACIAMHSLNDNDRASYLGTPFIAPDVKAGLEPAPQDDIYSLALVFAELLSNTSLLNFQGSPQDFISRIPGVSNVIKDTLLKATNTNRADRFDSLAKFKDALKIAVDAPADSDLSSIVVGVNDLRALNPSSDFPAISQSSTENRKPDLFESGSHPAQPRCSQKKVWIYVKDGMDFGPFTHEELIKRFYDDEIDESTGIRNTHTKIKQNLGSIEEFKKEIQEFLPTRDHNRKIKQNALKKKKQQKKLAAGSGIFIVLIVIALIVIVPLAIVALSPKPDPLNFSNAFPVFAKQFTAPQIEEFSLKVDASKAKALFDPNATQAEIEAAQAAYEAENRRKHAGRKKLAANANSANPFGDDVDSIVFNGKDGEELPTLEDWEIEEKFMSPVMYHRQRECFNKYAGGRKMDITISFVIQQSGTIRNITTTANGNLGDCLVSTVSSVKFHPFGGTVKRVKLPVGY